MVRNAYFAALAGVLIITAACAHGATAGPADQPARHYVDSSRSGVLEFLDVVRTGQAVRVRFERYRQDFSFCSGVSSAVDAHDGRAHGETIEISGGGTMHMSATEIRLLEPGSRGVHRFHRLTDGASKAGLIRSFSKREDVLRRSMHVTQHLAGAAAHCKR